MEPRTEKYAFRTLRSTPGTSLLYTAGLFKVRPLTVPQATPGPTRGFLAGLVDVVLSNQMYHTVFLR